MRSRLYIGQVAHERFHPAPHRLQYNLYVYAFDLAELETLDRSLPLFGCNRPRPVSLYDRDYLDPTTESIRDKLNRRLSPHLPAGVVHRVVMVTSPRLLGHAFNPVTLYYCFDAQERFAAAVAEVNNTFGEKHVYVLATSSEGSRRFPARFQAPKSFHVSPFNTMEGTYHFRFGDIRQELDIRIDLHRDEKHILRAHLTGTPRDLTPMSQLKLLLRHPVMPHLTMSRIYKEAFLLRFRRNLDFYPKPVPRSPMTIRRLPPTTLQRHCMKRVLGHLAGADAGHLQLVLPNGARRDFGGEKITAPARLRVNDYRFFSRVALGSDIGLGEAFVSDEWDTDDIPAVIGLDRKSVDLDLDIQPLHGTAEGLHQVVGTPRDLGVLELSSPGDHGQALADGVQLREVVGIGLGHQILGCDGFLHLVRFHEGQLDPAGGVGIQAKPSAGQGCAAEAQKAGVDLLLEDVLDVRASPLKLPHGLEETALDRVALGALGEVEQGRAGVLEEFTQVSRDEGRDQLTALFERRRVTGARRTPGGAGIDHGVALMSIAAVP